MKKYLTILSIFVVSITMAQERGESMRESIRAQKVGYLTTQVGLTSAEAEKFWPIYNERENALELLKKERRANRKSYREGLETQSDGELEKLLDREISIRGEEHEVIQKYHEIFKKSIGVKKTAKLYRAESKFNTKLVRGVRDKAQQSRERGGRGNNRAE